MFILFDTSIFYKSQCFQNELKVNSKMIKLINYLYLFMLISICPAWTLNVSVNDTWVLQNHASNRWNTQTLQMHTGKIRWENENDKSYNVSVLLAKVMFTSSTSGAGAQGAYSPNFPYSESVSWEKEHLDRDHTQQQRWG